MSFTPVLMSLINLFQSMFDLGLCIVLAWSGSLVILWKLYSRSWDEGNTRYSWGGIMFYSFHLCFEGLKVKNGTYCLSCFSQLFHFHSIKLWDLEKFRGDTTSEIDRFRHRLKNLFVFGRIFQLYLGLWIQIWKVDLRFYLAPKVVWIQMAVYRWST